MPDISVSTLPWSSDALWKFNTGLFFVQLYFQMTNYMDEKPSDSSKIL